MSKTTNQIRNLTMMALFVAIEIILLVTPFGYLRIGPLSATLMHVPVIVCACVMSTKFGAFLGLVFGFLYYYIGGINLTDSSIHAGFITITSYFFYKVDIYRLLFDIVKGVMRKLGILKD